MSGTPRSQPPDSRAGPEAAQPPYVILHLVSTFAPKTDTKWLLQIARHLGRDRFRLHAACFYEGGDVASELERLGVATDNLNCPNTADPRAILRAARLIDRVRPDLVHSHLLRADLLGGLAARLSGVPCVSTAYAIGDYRRAVQRRTDGLLDAVTRLLPDRVLAVAEAVRDDCVDRLAIAKGSVRVIRTGVDPPERIDPQAVAAVRQSLGAGPADRLIVTLARLSYEKGVEVLVEAAVRLLDRLPRTRVAIFGEGPLRASLEDRIRKAGRTEGILLAGFRDNVWPVLEAADLFCLPSRMEGMPNALLEAMALAKPVVASNVGGIPEAVTHGLSGWLVPPGNADALAQALERVAGDGTLAAKLGNEARRVVESRFLARDIVAEYGRWYESLITPQPP